MNSGKSLTPSVPPSSLTTVFTSVSVGAWSSLVIVQVFDSPTAIVPEQSADSVFA